MASFDGLGRWFKKRLEGGVAQINPFDDGRTYNTVLNNQQPTPGRGLAGRAWDQVNPLDNSRTFNQAQPEMASTFDKYSPRNIWDAAWDAPKQLISNPNAHKVQIGQGMSNPLVRIGGQILADAVNSPFTVSSGANRVGDGDVYGGLGEIGKGVLDNPATQLLPIGRVSTVFKGAKGLSLANLAKEGAKTGVKVGGAFGGAYGAAQAASENAKPLDLAKSTALGAGFGAAGGAVLGGGAPVVGAGVRIGAKAAPQAAKKLGPKVPENLLQTRNQLVVGRANAKSKRPDLIPMFDKQIDAIDREIDLARQGGFVKVPGSGAVGKNVGKPNVPEVPTDPLAALKQEALKHKSADEFANSFLPKDRLYHGTNRNFDNFDVNRSFRARNKELGAGGATYFSSSKNIAEQYANANANASFDPHVIGEVAKTNKNAAELMRLIHQQGYDQGWKTFTDRHPIPTGGVDEWGKKLFGNIDPNHIGDVAEYIRGAKPNQEMTAAEELQQMFGGSSSSIPSHIKQKAASLGIKSIPGENRVIPTYVTPGTKLKDLTTVETENPIAAAQKARSEGYDGMVFRTVDSVEGVPETAVWNTNKLLTDKQLTDLYNQAHAEAKTPRIQKLVTPPKQGVKITNSKPSASIAVKEAPPRTQGDIIGIPPNPPMKVTAPAMSPPERPGIGTKSLPSGKTKATKFASKTVPESAYVSEGVKGSIKSPEYSPQTEKQGYAHALGKLQAQGNDAFENGVFKSLDKKAGTISRQEAIDATTHAQLLDSQADEASIRKATEIYEKLSEHYTAAGQTIQVAAILSRRTPEGMRGWATSTLLKAGVTPDTQLQAQIVELAQAKDFSALADLVARNIPSSRGDKIINLWRAGLLTSPTTTGGNLLGNTGEAIVRKGFVNPVATGSDALMSLFTGKRTMTLAKPGQYAGGFKQGAKEFGKGVDNTKYDVQKRTNYNTRAIDAYVNGVYKLMGVADLPFSKSASRESLSSMAKAEAINQGLKGDAKAKFIKDFIANPPEQAQIRAQTEGDFAVFKNPTTLGKAATGLKRPLGPVGDFVVPFTQVPAAIATRIVQRTPIGTAQEVIKQMAHIKSGGEFDQRAMSQAIGNGAFGPAVMGVGYALANSDMLTFGYPTDSKERALFEEQGKQPYSVRVGDRWYSLNYLQPFGTLLAIGGQAANVAKEGGDIGEVVGQGMATAAQSITNQSFLKGVSGVLDVVSDPERNVRKYVEQTSSSVVPNFVRSFARATDPIQRKPEGVVEGVKSAIPGLRQSTTPKYSDITGDPLPAKDNAVNQFLNPLRPSIARDSALTSELSRLQEAGEGIIPTSASKDVFGPDSGISKKQLNELNSKVAKDISTEWQKVIKDPRYKSLSDDDKQKVLNSINSVVGPASKADYAAKNDFISDSWEPKLSKKSKDWLAGQGSDFLADAGKKGSVKVSSRRRGRRRGGGRGRKPGSISVSTPETSGLVRVSASLPKASVKKPGITLAKKRPTKIVAGKIKKA